MSSNHGYGKSKKKEMLKKWDESNIFGNAELDMFGILMDSNNIESVHHIFDRYGNCVGVSCLSRYLHDYLDIHLKNADSEEYYKWNEYLKDVYEYITNNARMISLYELKVLRSKLLDSVSSCDVDKLSRNKRRNYLKITEKLKPYLAKESCDINSLYRTLPNTYNFIRAEKSLVDSSSAVNKYFENLEKLKKYKMELDYVSSLHSLDFKKNFIEVDSSSAVNKYFEKLKKYEIELDYVSSLHSLDFKKNFIEKVKLNKNKELSKMISENCNTDALGLNLGYMTEKDIDIEKLFGEDVFLYERSIDILRFVKKFAPLLYDDWISLLLTYTNRTDDYEEKAYDLRKRTYILLRKKGNSCDKKNKVNMLRLKKSLIQNNYISKQA